MQKALVILFVLIAQASPLRAPSHSSDAFELLPGYIITRETGVDVAAWRIEKPGGLIIHFEAGPSEGLAVNPAEKKNYAWCREQLICGRKVLVALVRPGVRYDSELDKERDLPPGNELLVSFPLGGHKYHAANFVAKIANPEEMADMLLMALSFDPSKGSF